MLLPRRRPARFLAWIAIAALASPSTLAFAEPPSKLSPDQQEQARQHNTRAHDLYQQGAYREAIVELEAALVFDPNGKDLLFNLGVVNEKLGNIDDAIKYFKRYESMDLDPAERARADSYMKRLEGARKEVAEKPAQDTTPPPPPPPAQPPPPPVHGRVDVFTIGAAVVTVVGLGVGTGFGLRALAVRPPSGFVTGVNGSFVNLQDETQKAHRDAQISDVGFAAGLVGAAATAYLYFARTRDTAARSTSDATTRAPRIEVSGAPLPGGGALFLGGRF